MADDHNIDPAVALESTVEDLIAASKEPARSRQQDVSVLVTSIAEHAYVHGLSTPVLEKLLEVLTSKTTLTQSDTTTLITNLFPAQRVPSASVISIASCLGVGSRKPSLVSQALLLRWLCNVHSALEDHSVLARIYSVLWNHLDLMSIRPALCQLLALITRRQHVKPFRIQQLFTLSSAAGDTYEFRLLCDAFRAYCPDISFGPRGNARPSAAVKSDAAWRARLAELRASRPAAGRANVDPSSYNGRPSSHGQRVVPLVQTRTTSASAVGIETVENVVELVECLEVVELPSQMAATLRHPLLQQYLQLRPSMDADERLQFWLAQCLDDLLSVDGSEQSPALVAEVLSLVTGYVRVVKIMPPIVEAFVRRYLVDWNGVSNVTTILELLSYSSGNNFAALHQECLRVLETRIGRNNPNSLETLTEFYSALLRRRILAQSTTQGPEEAAFISDLHAHVTTLHLSTLVSLSEGNATISSIVRFYESLAHLAQSSASASIATAAVMLPPPHIIFLITFSFQLDALSRLCTVLTVYKAAFEAGMKAAIRWPADLTNRFNGYLMDICNLLWRSRALTTADPNAAGCLCPATTAASLRGYVPLVDREYALASLYGLSHNMLLASFSLGALQQLERTEMTRTALALVAHVGPASQRTLNALEKEGGAKISWRDYRVASLQWLHDHGVSGLQDLMYATMRDLAKPA